MLMLKRIYAINWPSGDNKPVLELSFSAEEFSRRTGLDFEPIDDDLGPAVATATELPEVGAVLFLKYKEAPADNIAAYVDYKLSTELAIDCLIKSLQLDAKEVVWRRAEE